MLGVEKRARIWEPENLERFRLMAAVVVVYSSAVSAASIDCRSEMLKLVVVRLKVASLSTTAAAPSSSCISNQHLL
jgi:hypothetical protein